MRQANGASEMTALKQLSAVYVAIAGAFTIAMAMSAHPDWTKTAESAARFLRVHGAATAVAIDEQVIRPGWVLAQKEGKALGRRIAAALHAPPAQIAQNRAPKIAQPSHALHAVAPVQEASRAAARPVTTPMTEAAPSVLRGEATDSGDKVAAAQPPAKPALTLAPQAMNPAPGAAPANAASPAPNPAEVARVEQRLKDNLTGEMFANFGLFLYVSKANSGPWAQRMYVFQKRANGDLVLLYDWPVSTGREKVEFTPAGQRMTTITPSGYYELDPKRSYTRYRSAEWNRPMPYAMFFNWIRDGSQTGFAIHAATGDDVALLGSRASAGCIHLSLDNAQVLFTLIRSQYRGLAPRFAIDRHTGTMSNDGILLHDADGHVQMADGYKVLVFIENYGGQNVVAALF